MQNCYVKAYYDWIEQTAALSDAERGRLFIAILEYARSGREPKLDGRESILFPVFKSVIDRDAQKSAVNSVNGAKGGRRTKANESELKRIEANESDLKRLEANESEVKPTKDKDKDNNKDKDYNTSLPNGRDKRHKRGSYQNVLLSDAEMEKLREEFPDLDQRIERLSEYMASTGKRYKSHLATIRAWARKDTKQAGSRFETKQYGDALDKYMDF